MERYFDDVEAGQRFHSKEVTLADAEIANLILAHDSQPFHIHIEARLSLRAGCS